MKIRRKNKKNIFLKVVFFTAIILYFTYKVITGLLFKEPLTEIASYGEISIEDKYECLIVRNEKVVNSRGEGIIKYYVEEGEKIEKGYKIADIYTSNVKSEDKEKLIELNERINNIQSSVESLFEVDITKLDEEIHFFINEIRKYKSKQNLNKIQDYKVSLISKLEKKRRINGDKSFSGYNLEYLKDEKSKLEERIKNSILEVTSPESGLISYNIDGFEDIFTPKNLSKLDFNYVKTININLNNTKLDKVIYDQPIFKVIDNTSWYIVILTDINEANTFKKGQKVFVEIFNKTIEGVVQDIYSENTNSLIIVRTNQYAKNFYKIRKMNLNIIKQRYSGLKIHRDCIIEKGRQLGVYILDVNKKTVFRPIKIKTYNDDFAIVYSTFYYENEKNQSKRVNTIKLYDEILRNGKKYKEGQIIY